MDHLDHAAVAALPSAAPTQLAEPHPMIAIQEHIRALADASGLPGEWHNTVTTLLNAADFLTMAAERIAGGPETAAQWASPPEVWVKAALGCVGMTFDGNSVRPVMPLAM